MSNDNEVLVKVEGVSKIFCRDLKKSLWYGLKDSAHDLLSWGRKIEDSGSQIEDSGSQIADEPCDALSNSKSLSSSSHSKLKIKNSKFSPRAHASEKDLRQGEFYAVRDVSFTLRRGECLGLIGRNGAGKTTLLKMLNGLIKPDAGRIEMHGRIGALIALGSGFNPILSGRENIYVNGSVLGLTKKEIDEKIDEIIDFAEIREFIDSPVQTYSSGMSVRLGFSVASSLSPDILILDEVLAVGDIGFIIKCLNRVRELASSSAVIFVSHTMQFVSSFCTRVIVMEHGRCLLDTDKPQVGINCYLGLLGTSGSESGDGGAEIVSFVIQTAQALIDTDPIIAQGEDVSIELAFRIDSCHAKSFVRMFIDDESQTQVIGYPMIDDSNTQLEFGPGVHKVRVPLGPLDLNAGRYTFLVTISNARSKATLLRKSGISPFRVTAENTLWSKIIRPSKAAVLACDNASLNVLPY